MEDSTMVEEMEEAWTNRGKFNGLSSHEIGPKKGEAVWDPRRKIEGKDWGPNPNGIVKCVFYQDEEAIVHWYDTPVTRSSSQIMNFNEFYGKWTDKYGGGYWLDDGTAPGR